MQQPKYFNTLKKIFNKLNIFFENNWRLAVLDTTAGRWVVKTNFSNLSYLKAENANNRHIIMQPVNEEYFILADDITPKLLQLHHKNIHGLWKNGRLIIETSPGNYQVWIHSLQPLRLDEKRYWLKKMHSDPGADPHNRWGRCPGFRNRKQKHRTPSGQYPLARLIWVDWKNKAIIPKVESSSSKNINFSNQPKGFVCHNKNFSRSNYNKGNESITDFSYALALARRGYDFHTIKTKIINERENWNNHLGGNRVENYLNRTITKAMNIVFSS